MKFVYKLCLLLIFINFSGSVHAQDSSPSNDVSIIPQPVNMKIQEGAFTIEPTTKIVIKDRKLLNVAQFLNNHLESATWEKLKITDAVAPSDTSIVLEFDDSGNYVNDEAYNLTVTPSRVTIKAPTAAGIFYGIQSLRQLLPPQIEYTDPTLVPQNVEWRIPAVVINDYPRYEYRGLHLDVGRHFFPVTFVKKYIDLMSLYKMNRFHWHLTEDQGWRIQIKKYPKLTKIGAWRDSTLIGHYGSGRYEHEAYGGFYTQNEIREVVRYAKKRHITIIPEIEMPGHASAALASYPELGCEQDKGYHVQSTWGIFEDIYCPREKTFTFLENVLKEVIDLFPGKYIHIGGDEAPKTAWKNSDFAQQVIQRKGLKDEEGLQSYFISRIEKFLNKHDRQIIGWDEILQGGLAPNATVMSWRGTKGGIAAAKQHHNVIMTPSSHLYLDYYQADPKTEPLSIGGFIPLKKTYLYEPTPDTLNKKELKYILGAQGNVWTEYIDSGKKVMYMAYPRAIALAEVVWSPKNKRNWESFLRRIQSHFTRLNIMGVNVAEHYRTDAPSKKQIKNH